MTYPLVPDLAADKIPVTVTCRVLGFSPQAFYKWKTQPVSQRDWDDAHLIDAAYDIHADDPAFGYRFIADELPARGIRAGENRVARLFSQQRIWSVFAKKRGLNRKAGPPVHDDLVGRRCSSIVMEQLHHRYPTDSNGFSRAACRSATMSGRGVGVSVLFARFWLPSSRRRSRYATSDTVPTEKRSRVWAVGGRRAQVQAD